MKKIFVRITMAVTMAAAMAACARVEEPLSSDGETRQVTLSVNIPQSDLDSKAAGDGTQVNQCILQIYCGEDKYGDPVVESVAGGTADFKLQLVTGQNYKFVLWADAGGSDNSDNHYDTREFPEVAFSGDYTGNDDSWDAFCASVDITGFNGTLEPVTLTRPFGQLNIYTEDIDEIKAGTLKPDKVRVKFNSIPASYDIISGVSSGKRGIEYTADVFETSDGDSDGKYLLSTDYIFAPSTEQALSDFTMTFLNGDTEITSYDFSDIPLQRNYRTNVSGNLLTKTGTLSVTVEAVFGSPDIEKEVRAVAALSDVKAALDNGADIVDVTGDAYGDLVLPAADRDITVNLKGSVTGNVTVKSEEDNYRGHFTISNETEGDNSHDLVINLPNGSASVDGKWNGIDVTTADNTFVLESSSEVCTLTVKKGNVELYGKVKKALIKGEGYTGTIYRCLSDQLSMDNLINDRISSYSSVLVKRPTDGQLDGKAATFSKPFEITADADFANFAVILDKGSKAQAMYINGDVSSVKLSGLKLQTNTEYSVVKLAATDCSFSASDCSFVITPSVSNQSGLLVSNSGSGNTLNVMLKRSYIGFNDYAGRINRDKNTDYTEIENFFQNASYSRGITLANNGSCDGSEHTVLRIADSYIEGAYYSVNTLHNIKLDIDIENSVFDGRAALNLWTTSDRQSDICVRNSKFIGRNNFAGPTEEFATVVFNDQNADDNNRWVKNVTVMLDGCDIVSYNNPQTETNRQFAADMRSKEYNRLVLKNGTKLREISNPRLDYMVDVDCWINEVEDDGTTVIEGKEGATLLESNVWDGSNSLKVPSAANDGKYYIGTPVELYSALKFQKKGDYILVRDIDLNNKDWPVCDTEMSDFKSFSGNFDGQGHVIRNLVCKTFEQTSEGGYGLAWDNKSQNAGLFGIFKGELKNLTVDGAEIYGSRSGVLVGRLDGGSISNCNVLNAEITGGAQKMGLLVGYVNSGGGFSSPVVIESCSVENGTVNKDPEPPQGDASCMAGGLIGYLQLVNLDAKISNNKVSNVNVVSGGKWDNITECSSHVFVGDVINLSNDGAIRKVEFENNEVSNCSLENATVSSSATEFYGFCYSSVSELTSSHNVVNTIIVDGVTVVHGQSKTE